MRIWLDDVRPIREGFDIHCWSAEAALELIKGGTVTYISFDNDLGEGRMEGYQLANLIEEMAFNAEIPPMGWNIHSANPVGERNILAAMRNADQFWKDKGAT